MDSQKIMKDLGLNEPVAITLPAHIWHGFISAYAAAKWSSTDTSIIAKEVIQALFEPLYLSEKEAAMQEQHDQHEAALRTILTGRLPEMPPGMEDL